MTTCPIISVTVALEPGSHVNREEFIDRLFQGVPTDGSACKWEEDTFSLYGNPVVKQYLLSLLGGHITLTMLDANIQKLITEHKATLESMSDDEIILRSGKISCNVELIVKLIASSLSHDLISTVRTLLMNISEILSSEDFFAKTQRIDVSLFKRNSDQNLLVFHSRFSSCIIHQNWAACVFFMKRRALRLNVSLRRICINQQYVEKMEGTPLAYEVGAPPPILLPTTLLIKKTFSTSSDPASSTP